MNSSTRIRLLPVLAVAALVLLAALAGYWVRGEKQSATGAESGPGVVRSKPVVPAQGTGSKEAPAPAAPRPLPPSLPPLAPLEASFTQQLSALTQRADAGDPVAACRLIVGANRCVEAARNRAFTELMVRSLESREAQHDDVMVQTVARARERGQANDEFCGDIDPVRLPSADALYRKAAPALSVRQKVVLALLRSDGRIRRLYGNPSFSESSLYVLPQFLSDHTHEFLLQGYAARDPLALEGLVMIHAPGRAIHPQGIRLALPNPRLFIKYAGLLRRLHGDAAIEGAVGRLMQATAETLDAATLAQLDREIEAEYRRWTASGSVSTTLPPLDNGLMTSQALCAD